MNIRTELEKYNSDIKEEVKKNQKMLKEDKVKLCVDELVHSGRVGPPFSISELIKIFSEGEQRYKYKIPPGYEDEEKDKNDKTKRRKFGDLILWKQVLEKARLSPDSPVIFITLDEKEDWWVLDDDNAPIKPRDELLVEFGEYSKQPLVMLSLTNFINHVTIINSMPNLIAHLEMNAESICCNLIENAGWDVILDDGLQLTSFLINSGDLQEYLANPLADVEIVEVSSPEIEIDSVSISEDQVIAEGSFQTKVVINITESFSKNYSEDFESEILISGSVSFEFQVDFKKFEEDVDFIKIDTLDILVGGFEILDFDEIFDETYNEEECCINCGNPDAPYFTKAGEPVCENCSNNYEICPECGRLFEKGTLSGPFCQECERAH